MQCPKCRYEPTLAEVQRSPDLCVKCASSFSGGAVNLPPKKKSWKRLAVITGLIIVVFWVGAQAGFDIYKKSQTVEQASRLMREANGIAIEFFDSRITRNAIQFSAAASERIVKFDELTARGLALDDRYLPGIGLAVAGYCRSYRRLVEASVASALAQARLAVAVESLEKLRGMAESDSGKYILSQNDETFDRYITHLLDEAKNGAGFGERVESLKDASLAMGMLNFRNEFKKALAEAESSKGALEDARVVVSRAAAAVADEGKKIRAIAGSDVPIREWEMNNF